MSEQESPAEDAPADKSAQAEPVEAKADVEAEPETVEAQLEKAQAEAQRYLANWQRAEADFSNYKRRMEQERGEAHRMANAALIINILPVLDDIERALASLDIRLVGLTWFDGIRLIYRKLLLILESAGVSQIEAEGQAFDPRFHEAVMHGEGPEGKVVAEVQRGYKLHDRVLRPAMVVVGKGKGKPEAGGEKSDKQDGD
jgi:molecular chaperone GrpE